MKAAMKKWVGIMALSFLVVSSMGTVAHCDVVGNWTACSIQSAKTQQPGQAWETTAYNLGGESIEFGADGSYQVRYQGQPGSVGTWTETGPWGEKGTEYSVDIQAYLAVMWHQILLDRGMEGTFELTSYSLTVVQARPEGWSLRERLHYRGVAHVTSPVVMDVKVIGDAKRVAVRTVSAPVEAGGE